MTFEKQIKIIINNNLNNIKKYLKEKNITINNLDNLFDNVKVVLGDKKEYLYANISKDNPLCIVISEDIEEKDRFKWINHEMIHIISNNQDTINDINVGGIIIEDKEKNIWIGHYLNEAITEYINQSIIKDKYSDYYDLYIKELEKIIKLIGEDIILKAYFTNNLNLIINSLIDKTNYSRNEIINYIIEIDYLYDNNSKISLSDKFI